MKIKFDIDSTPQELRTFFGLPDLEPLQSALLEDMQRRMLAEMDKLSPAGLMRDWFTPATGGMQQALMQMFKTGGGSGPGAAKDTKASSDSE